MSAFGRKAQTHTQMKDDERAPQGRNTVCRYDTQTSRNRRGCTQDEVNAPSKEWHRIEEEVNAKLRALPILPEDAPPVLPGRKELCTTKLSFFFCNLPNF